MTLARRHCYFSLSSLPARGFHKQPALREGSGGHSPLTNRSRIWWRNSTCTRIPAGIASLRRRRCPRLARRSPCGRGYRGTAQGSWPNTPRLHHGLDRCEERPHRLLEPPTLVGHLLGNLHREQEPPRDLAHQRRHHVGGGDAVVGGVYLHRLEPPGIVGEPGLLGKPLRVHRAHPVRKGVARSPDPDLRQSQPPGMTGQKHTAVPPRKHKGLGGASLDLDKNPALSPRLTPKPTEQAPAPPRPRLARRREGQPLQLLDLLLKP